MTKLGWLAALGLGGVALFVVAKAASAHLSSALQAKVDEKLPSGGCFGPGCPPDGLPLGEEVDWVFPPDDSPPVVRNPSVRNPVSFHRDGPFSDLPLGTVVTRKGWPSGSLDPDWKITAKTAPGEFSKYGMRLDEWEYTVSPFPSYLELGEGSATINESAIEALV